MKTNECFLNLLDGVLLALAMAWTLTFAAALLHPTAAHTGASEVRATIDDRTRNL